ncbi:MAG: hypothetical protein R2941_15685 [Desulfobacterales bacterium]
MDSYLGVLDDREIFTVHNKGLVMLRHQSLPTQVKLYAVLGGGGGA